MTELVNSGRKFKEYDFFYKNRLLAEEGYELENRIHFEDFIDKNALYTLNKTHFQQPMSFMVMDDDAFENLSINIDQIIIDNSIKFDLAIYNITLLKNQDWHPKRYFNCIQKELIIDRDFTINLENSRLEDATDMDEGALCFTYQAEFVKSIIEHINELRIKLSKITLNVKNILNGFSWKYEYEKKEELFTSEVIIPLLRKMRFNNIVYNHGIKEYGRDIIFSNLDEFGNLNNYGVQVKAGNLSGNVNSAVDEIIGQVNDAFAMPFYNTQSKSENYIAAFFIIISGFFTENAKQKIVHKIPKGVTGAIYFFDKDKILELVQKHWNN